MNVSVIRLLSLPLTVFSQTARLFSERESTRARSQTCEPTVQLRDVSDPAAAGCGDRRSASLRPLRVLHLPSAAVDYRVANAPAIKKRFALRDFNESLSCIL